jgi:N-carbamoyl-L-amino-acid hydrolase
MHIMVDQDRLTRELAELSVISAAPAPSVTRVVFTETDLRGRDFVKRLCHDAGLSVREDAVGNTFARWAGSEPAEAPVGTGSHIDAIPNAGMYDGTVGVLGGLEAIRALVRGGHRPRRGIELLLFTAEEPTRFGIGCLGSRLLAGSLNESAGERLKDNGGRTLNETRAAAGFAGPLSSVALTPGYYSAFVELHIEQGPILEKTGVEIGVVTAIAAPAGLKLWIEGQGGHAGAVLMDERHDAFLAAAEIALAIEREARSTGSRDTVATTGVCDIFPSAVNSIPSRVRLEMDVRDIDLARRDAVLRKIDEAVDDVSARRGVGIRKEIVNADAPATCDARIVEALESACRKHQVSHQRMISRAYHDSLFIASLAPTAMVFIPCRGGVSHRPDEYSTPEAIAQGALILAETLADLSK